MTEYPKYLGLRILVGGAIIDKIWFDTPFETHLALTIPVINALQASGINCELTQDQINAVRDGHASREMYQVFEQYFWPAYKSERVLGNIGDAAQEGYWTPEHTLTFEPALEPATA